MEPKGRERAPTEKTRKHAWPRSLPFAATGLLLLVLLGVGITGAHPVQAAATPMPAGEYTLATVPEVTALAAIPGTVFATSGLNCSEVWAVSPAGAVTLYASVPVPVKSCGEGGLVVAPGNAGDGQWGQAGGSDQWGQYGGDGGNGGCGCNDFILYYAVESQLFAITNSGHVVTWVASFKLAPTLDLSVTYDSVGLFNHDVIVTGQGGSVWLVNNTGGVSLLVDLKTHVEGPAVAPWGFGTLGGDILLTAQSHGEVYAISPSATVTAVTSMPKAEDVAFPSPNENCGQCGYEGPSSGVFFVANFAAGTIEAFPMSTISGLTNQGFVDGEFNAGVASFTATGTSTPFAPGSADLEQITFVACVCEHGCDHGSGNGCGNGGNGCGNGGQGGNGCGNGGQGGNGCGNGGQGGHCSHGNRGGDGW